jgi:hypothetical protein
LGHGLRRLVADTALPWLLVFDPAAIVPIRPTIIWPPIPPVSVGPLRAPIFVSARIGLATRFVNISRWCLTGFAIRIRIARIRERGLGRSRGTRDGVCRWSGCVSIPRALLLSQSRTRSNQSQGNSASPNSQEHARFHLTSSKKV